MLTERRLFTANEIFSFEAIECLRAALEDGTIVSLPRGWKLMRLPVRTSIEAVAEMVS